MTAMIATLLALTLPQRKAMGAHLVAYASQWEAGYGPISLLQAQEIATQILEPTRDQIDRNLAVLKAAVFLNPARGLISSRDLATLTRAWVKLGWSWEWPRPIGPGDQAQTLITQAASGIRNIMNPAPPEPAPEFPTRCGNGRKCRHHATGADRKWSCGPDAYEKPAHGSDDPAVVGEQEAEDTECQGHPAGPFDPQGETVYCDGSCRRTVRRRTPPAPVTDPAPAPEPDAECPGCGERYCHFW